MKLGQITPRESILVINQGDVKAHNNSSCVPDFNLDSSILSPSEQAKLLDLLSEYSDIFATQGTPPVQTTVVNHSMKTTGAHVRQPLRRTPVTLKDTIDQEVTRMLQQGIV